MFHFSSKDFVRVKRPHIWFKQHKHNLPSADIRWQTGVATCAAAALSTSAKRWLKVKATAVAAKLDGCKTSKTHQAYVFFPPRMENVQRRHLLRSGSTVRPPPVCRGLLRNGLLSHICSLICKYCREYGPFHVVFVFPKNITRYRK